MQKTTQTSPQKTVSIKCRECKQTIPAGCLEPLKGLAKCLNCDEVFYYAGPLAGAEEPQRLPVPIPYGFDLRRDTDYMLLSWRWLEPSHGMLLLFTLIVDGLLLWTLGRFAFDALQDLQHIPWWKLGASTGHLVTAIGMTYYLMACLLNRTLIRVSKESLTLVHRPVPMPGGFQLLPVMIGQLYVAEKIKRRRSEDGPRDDLYYVTYDLRARLKDGTEQTLLNLPETEQAECIEVQIEHYLGIADKAVEGEVAKRL